MKGLNSMKYLLQKGNYMCKLDQRWILQFPQHKDSRKLVRYLWEGNLYEFLCFCFGLVPDPKKITKVMKEPL